VLRIAGVAPKFMRTVVEELRVAGMDQPVTSMQVVGSLPLDPTAMSVREGQVKAWLDDPTAYLEPWPNPQLPSFGSSKSEFRAAYPVFDYARAPARAILSNMLVRFHERVVPLVAAEVQS
jgi:hypothetical protein